MGHPDSYSSGPPLLQVSAFVRLLSDSYSYRTRIDSSMRDVKFISLTTIRVPEYCKIYMFSCNLTQFKGTSRNKVAILALCDERLHGSPRSISDL